MAKVLVVEDNDLNIKLFNDLLAVKSHRVICIKQGADVFITAKREKPDLILMDIQLSDEVSGIEATKLLKQDPETAKIPIIIITAFAMKHDEVMIEESGCDMYLFKPVSIDNFFVAIDKYIGDNSV
jgi:two-component system cell cycle response regulator DivK